MTQSSTLGAIPTGTGAAVRAAIDAAAETARLAFITAGSGQALVYELVRLQAVDYAAHYSAANPPAIGTYPLQPRRVVRGEDVHRASLPWQMVLAEDP